MKSKRLDPDTLPAFKTFITNRPPAFIDCLTASENLTLWDQLPERGLAIVGSRYPQKRSLLLLEKTLQELAQTDLVIISGFAKGIDAYAHEMAIHHGLKTIAILGCGIDVDYPKENRVLRNRILDAGGMILSPFEKDAPPLAHHFYYRNGLIAGFSKAVWIVEAAEVSGTLNTAKWASEFNRDLYATPCFPSDPFYQGNLKLLSQRNTDRHPVAESLFSSESLTRTWADLHLKPGQRSFGFEKPRSTLQRWILELKTEYGECQIQTLLNYAHSKGKTPGQFYLDYEKDLNSGLISVDTQGRVDAVF